VQPWVEAIRPYVEDPQTAVILCPDWGDKEFVYYYDRELFRSYQAEYASQRAFRIPLEAMGMFSACHPGQFSLEPDLEQVLFVDHLCDFHCPDHGIRAHLEANFSLREEFSVHHVRFMRFERR
jgi:hypothetical protein